MLIYVMQHILTDMKQILHENLHEIPPPHTLQCCVDCGKRKLQRIGLVTMRMLIQIWVSRGLISTSYRKWKS